MKHNELRSIGHNLADSLASGIGLLIGVYEVPSVFLEAKNSSEGFILIDFLKGTTSGGGASQKLKNAVARYAAALPDFCIKHGVSVSDFRELTARFSNDDMGGRVLITIKDKNGRCSEDEYIGAPLRRIKAPDSLGRIRTKRSGKQKSEE